jgi:hypothetical protein
MITKGNLIFQLGTLFTVNSSIFFSFYLHDKYSINNKYDKYDKYDKYELTDILI